MSTQDLVVTVFLLPLIAGLLRLFVSRWELSWIGAAACVGALAAVGALSERLQHEGALGHELEFPRVPQQANLPDWDENDDGLLEEAEHAGWVHAWADGFDDGRPDGRIDELELARYMSVPPRLRAGLARTYAELDADHDGTLSTAELGAPPPAEADLDGDGHLTPAELAAYRVRADASWVSVGDPLPPGGRARLPATRFSLRWEANLYSLSWLALILGLATLLELTPARRLPSAALATGPLAASALASDLVVALILWQVALLIVNRRHTADWLRALAAGWVAWLALTALRAPGSSPLGLPMLTGDGALVTPAQAGVLITAAVWVAAWPSRRLRGAAAALQCLLQLGAAVLVVRTAPLWWDTPGVASSLLAWFAVALGCVPLLIAAVSRDVVACTANLARAVWCLALVVITLDVHLGLVYLAVSAGGVALLHLSAETVWRACGPEGGERRQLPGAFVGATAGLCLVLGLPGTPGGHVLARLLDDPRVSVFAAATCMAGARLYRRLFFRRPASLLTTPLAGPTLVLGAVAWTLASGVVWWLSGSWGALGEEAHLRPTSWGPWALVFSAAVIAGWFLRWASSFPVGSRPRPIPALWTAWAEALQRWNQSVEERFTRFATRERSPSIEVEGGNKPFWEGSLVLGSSALALLAIWFWG
ncbi:MAG: hypothetical protein KDD82_29715 [Planctomycetes bacterium]|nr:hypothetical protein [Planctomycetota bacterium]